MLEERIVRVVVRDSGCGDVGGDVVGVGM